MSIWKKYVIASSVPEALDALRAASGEARPVGGGTDLLLEIQQGRHAPVDTLVDLTRIPELNRIEICGDELFIGASVTVRIVAESSLVRTHASAVSEACDLIGGPQVRNTATLGGNVAHALPAADGMIALVALDAQVEIADSNGRRRAPILSIFRGPGISTLVPKEELITGFFLPVRKVGQASAFSRVMRPQGVALPILNMAAWMAREGNRMVDLRIAVGPAGPTPQRAIIVEDFLRGSEYSSERLLAAEKIWGNSMKFRTSAMRATAQYRYHLANILLVDVIEKTWKRSQVAEVL
jgi:xanthine dehydrogenase FAD-binding subunit